MMPRSYFCVCTFICAWVCACTYVYMCGLYVPEYVHAHMCTCVCRTEDNLKCHSLGVIYILLLFCF